MAAKGKIAKRWRPRLSPPMMAMRIVARATRIAARHEPPVPHRLPRRLPPAAGLVVLPPAACAMVPRWRSGRATRCSWCAPPTGRSSTCPAAASSGGEAPLWRAVRELREETGLEAEPAELVAPGRVPLRGQPSPDHDVPVHVAAAEPPVTRRRPARDRLGGVPARGQLAHAELWPAAQALSGGAARVRCRAARARSRARSRAPCDRWRTSPCARC